MGVLQNIKYILWLKDFRIKRKMNLYNLIHFKVYLLKAKTIVTNMRIYILSTLFNLNQIYLIIEFIREAK